MSSHGPHWHEYPPDTWSGTVPGDGMASRNRESSTAELCDAKIPSRRICAKISTSCEKEGRLRVLALSIPKNWASRGGIGRRGRQMPVRAETISPPDILTAPYSTTPIFLEPSKSIMNIGVLMFFILPMCALFGNIRGMDTESFKVFINSLADMTGEYIAKSFGGRVNVDYKSDESPVTEVDKNSEMMMREAIKKEYPTHGIIGEEFGVENPDSEFVWVLDPIDGTKSFISAVPLFGTLVGLMYRGSPILGLINQPVLRQRMLGDCQTCLFNGKASVPSSRRDIDGMTLLTSDSRYCADLRSERGWRELEKRAAIARTWGDCYGYMLLCRGYAHVMCDAILEVWDATALIPCMRGCGISFSDWCGGNDIGPKGLVASCTADLHRKVLEVLNTK